MSHEVKWAGEAPKQCDLCSKVIVDDFFDARVPLHAQWGILCRPCFKSYRCELGVGRGQHFKRQGGDFVKVAG